MFTLFIAGPRPEVQPRDAEGSRRESRHGVLPLTARATRAATPIPEQGWMGHEEIGIHWSGTPEDDLAALETLLWSLSPGLYRIVLHPAEDSAESRAVDSISGVDEALRRDSQLRAIESPRLQRAIEEADIELVSVRDRWDYQNCRLR